MGWWKGGKMVIVPRTKWSMMKARLRDLLTRGARTGQGRREATGEVPVTGREAPPGLPGVEGSVRLGGTMGGAKDWRGGELPEGWQSAGDCLSQEVTRETTWGTGGLRAPWRTSYYWQSSWTLGK